MPRRLAPAVLAVLATAALWGCIAPEVPEPGTASLRGRTEPPTRPPCLDALVDGLNLTVDPGGAAASGDASPEPAQGREACLEARVAHVRVAAPYLDVLASWEACRGSSVRTLHRAVLQGWPAERFPVASRRADSGEGFGFCGPAPDPASGGVDGIVKAEVPVLVVGFSGRTGFVGLETYSDTSGAPAKAGGDTNVLVLGSTSAEVAAFLARGHWIDAHHPPHGACGDPRYAVASLGGRVGWTRAEVQAEAHHEPGGCLAERQHLRLYDGFAGDVPFAFGNMHWDDEAHDGVMHEAGLEHLREDLRELGARVARLSVPDRQPIDVVVLPDSSE